MTDPDEIGRAVVPLADILDALGVAWAVGGSVASAAYGEPRATNDVDIIAALSAAQARAFVAALGDGFYADTDAATDAVLRGASFNVIDRRSFIKVDVFVPPKGPMGLGQLDRRVPLGLFPTARPLPVLGPEDTVLQKLKWYWIGGEASDRQWRDIVSVLRNTRGHLDDAYLDEVAGTSGLHDLLARARRDARDGADGQAKG